MANFITLHLDNGVAKTVVGLNPEHIRSYDYDFPVGVIKATLRITFIDGSPMKFEGEDAEKLYKGIVGQNPKPKVKYLS